MIEFSENGSPLSEWLPFAQSLELRGRATNGEDGRVKFREDQF